MGVTPGGTQHKPAGAVRHNQIFCGASVGGLAILSGCGYNIFLRLTDNVGLTNGGS